MKKLMGPISEGTDQTNWWRNWSDKFVFQTTERNNLKLFLSLHFSLRKHIVNTPTIWTYTIKCLYYCQYSHLALCNWVLYSCSLTAFFYLYRNLTSCFTLYMNAAVFVLLFHWLLSFILMFMYIGVSWLLRRFFIPNRYISLEPFLLNVLIVVDWFCLWSTIYLQSLPSAHFS